MAAAVSRPLESFSASLTLQLLNSSVKLSDMPPPAHAARGRRPGHPETRTAILDAARALIARQGCGPTTLRAIARQAGVDSALVVHYFTNRRGLLRAALRPENPIEFDFVHIITGGEPDECGQRLVSTFLEQLDAPDAQPSLMLKVIGMGLGRRPRR